MTLNSPPPSVTLLSRPPSRLFTLVTALSRISEPPWMTMLLVKEVCAVPEYRTVPPLMVSVPVEVPVPVKSRVPLPTLVTFRVARLLSA